MAACPYLPNDLWHRVVQQSLHPAKNIDFRRRSGAIGRLAVPAALAQKIAGCRARRRLSALSDWHLSTGTWGDVTAVRLQLGPLHAYVASFYGTWGIEAAAFKTVASSRGWLTRVHPARRGQRRVSVSGRARPLRAR
jgi:hypothetical protein